MRPSADMVFAVDKYRQIQTNIYKLCLSSGLSRTHHYDKALDVAYVCHCAHVSDASNIVYESQAIDTNIESVTATGSGRVRAKYFNGRLVRSLL